MSQPVILATNNQNFIEEQLNHFFLKHELYSNSPDVFKLQASTKQSIGIKDVKELHSWTAFKPYRTRTKVAIIQGSEALTVEAQNSMLKLLEEPPAYLQLILITNNYRLLLPTVLSRCLLIENYLQTETDPAQQLPLITAQAVMERVEEILNIKNPSEQKVACQILLSELLTAQRQILLKNEPQTTTIKSLYNINLINNTYKKISHNSLKRLALENLVFNLQ